MFERGGYPLSDKCSFPSINVPSQVFEMTGKGRTKLVKMDYCCLGIKPHALYESCNLCCDVWLIVM